MTTPPLGSTKDALDTPALCIDLDAMERNIQAIAKLCREHHIAWRPHSKGHKSPAIAKLEIAAGAPGITCAKLGEAEVMAAHGIRDLLVANLVVGPHKVRRLVALRKIADPIVCIDHLDQAVPISEAMAAAGLKCRAVIEVDIGFCRVGSAPGEATVELARQIAKLPGIELAGIMGFEGHLLAHPNGEEKPRLVHEALERLNDTKRGMLAAGLPCDIVSCGGTGSLYIAVEHPGMTEVQAGNAIFMDAFYRHKCQVAHLEYALTVLVTVVGRPTPERAIIDSGRKTLHCEYQQPLVVGREGILVDRLSAEHGQLKLEPVAQGLKIGERLELVPGYGDLTTMLHQDFYGFRNGKLEVIWPIEARGKLQ